jgi:uncharacterized protein (TIGR02246 family)
MTRHWIVTAAVALGALVGTAALAKGSKRSPEDEKGVRETVAAYGPAFDKADAEAFVQLLAPDAVFVTSGGKHVQGREAIIKRLMQYMARNPGDHMVLTVGGVRFLGDEVAQVDGNVEIRGPGGPPDITPYLALLVKRGGKWLFNSVRDLSSEPDEEEMPAAERLKALEWMVGEWRQKSGASVVEGSCRWDKNRNFLLWEYTVREGDEEVMSVTQRIGWDPQARGFRSWIFDSESGYAQGRWEPEGKTWVIQQAGVLPDGGTVSATAVLTPEGLDAFGWRMTNRREGGEKLPDVNVRFTRAAGQLAGPAAGAKRPAPVAGRFAPVAGRPASALTGRGRGRR